MVEPTSGVFKSQIATHDTVIKPLKTSLPMPSFKYYIHDSIESCRLQLLGHLTETDVPELKGCWQTARSTLISRKLILDLRGLTSVDDAGRQWLASMSTEGACYEPASFFETCLAAHSQPISEDRRPGRNAGLLRKLISVLRGLRISTESSTPAP